MLHHSAFFGASSVSFEGDYWNLKVMFMFNFVFNQCLDPLLTLAVVHEHWRDEAGPDAGAVVLAVLGRHLQRET